MADEVPSIQVTAQDTKSGFPDLLEFKEDLWALCFQSVNLAGAKENEIGDLSVSCW